MAISVVIGAVIFSCNVKRDFNFIGALPFTLGFLLAGVLIIYLLYVVEVAFWIAVFVILLFAFYLIGDMILLL